MLFRRLLFSFLLLLLFGFLLFRKVVAVNEMDNIEPFEDPDRKIKVVVGHDVALLVAAKNYLQKPYCEGQNWLDCQHK